MPVQMMPNRPQPMPRPPMPQQQPPTPIPPNRKPDARSPEQLKWFYLGDDGKTIGPFSLAQMNAWFVAKYFSERVHVRSELMDDFVPITQTPCVPKTGGATA